MSASSSQFSALLTLKVPLFAGFGDRAAVHQAEAQLDSARANSDDLRSQVELQVWQAYQNLRTAAATLDSSAAQLKSAELAADVSNARYKNGLDTILDLLSAQTTLANARVQQVQARLDWAAARTALGHAVGGLKAPANRRWSHRDTQNPSFVHHHRTSSRYWSRWSQWRLAGNGGKAQGQASRNCRWSWKRRQ